MVFLLLFAGHETTTHLISGATFELLKNPGLRDWLGRTGAGSISRSRNFCGSSRRCSSPSRATCAGMSNSAASGCGRATRSWPMLAAANMDPQANPHPERLDLQRKPNRHIAFGTGIHFCLGHQLARIEGRCALKSLFAALAGTRACGRSIRNHLAQAARPQGDRSAAGTRHRENSRVRGSGAWVV